MKKILITIFLTTAFAAVLAQKVLKPIHYTMVVSGNNKSFTKGDIQVSLKDSIVTIGEPTIKKFKIIEIAPEQTAISDDKILSTWLALLCTASDNRSCVVTIARQKNPNGTNIMNVQVQYDGAELIAYDCDYLQEIYN